LVVILFLLWTPSNYYELQLPVCPKKTHLH
jgi:hypothetical protein